MIANNSFYYLFFEKFVFVGNMLLRNNINTVTNKKKYILLNFNNKPAVYWILRLFRIWSNHGKSNHFKNVSNPNHFFKKPNPNQIQIQSNQIRKIMKNVYSKFCSLHIFWVRNDNCLIVYLSMIDNSSNKTK
jgi:hypothetical protein